MGYGIARSVLGAGHKVHGFDINPEQMTRFLAQGGEPGLLDDVAGSLDAVICVVLNGAQTQSVLGPLMSKLRKETVVISCATLQPALARQLASDADGFGLHYLDAPISGGAAKAAGGALSVMASGSAQAFAAAKPSLDAMAQTVFDLGDQPGAGSSMKAVNQLLAGVHIASMAEAMTFGMTQGVTPKQFVEVISQCAGTSWMLENRAPHIVDGDYTPLSAVDIWLKDLGIVLDIAKDAKFGAPITAAALQQFVAASGQGLGGEDDAAVAKVYARNAGLTLPGEAS